MELYFLHDRTIESNSKIVRSIHFKYIGFSCDNNKSQSQILNQSTLQPSSIMSQSLYIDCEHIIYDQNYFIWSYIHLF